MTAPPLKEAAVVQALGALAQATRLRIFRLLVVAGPAGLTPSQLCNMLDTPPTALSFHLKELSHAGLVLRERDGRHLIYRAAIPLMNDLLIFLTAHCCQGTPCLDASTPLDCNA